MVRMSHAEFFRFLTKLYVCDIYHLYFHQRKYYHKERDCLAVKIVCAFKAALKNVFLLQLPFQTQLY